MNPTQTLIQNGHLLTMDDRLGEMLNTDVLIEDGIIVKIATDIDAPNAQVIDASEHIVLPGFVDAHRHMWQTQMRGRMGDGTLLDYAAEIRNVFSCCYDPDDVYVGTLMGYLDALNAGCTTLIDHSHIMKSMEHSDAAINAFKDSGARGIFCYGLYPNPEENVKDSLERLLNPPGFIAQNAKIVRERHFNEENGHIRFGIALTELEWFPIEHTIKELEFARELNSYKISIHAGLGSSSHYTKFVERLHKEKQLSHDMHFVHGWGLTDHELKLIVEQGASLVATPETELQMAMGFPVTGRFSQQGGKAGLGIDIVSNQSADMFTQMRLALQCVRGQANEALAKKGLSPEKLTMTTEDVLKSATIDGAKSLKLEHEIGSLTVGKRADIQLISKTDINMVPVTNAIHSVVLCAGVNNIDTVMVNGEIIKRNGVLCREDLKGLTKRLTKSSEKIHLQAATFDMEKLRKELGKVFPLTKRTSMEQKMGAMIFNSKFKAAQRVLLKYILNRE
mgnify:CR=1 FL=1